MAIELLKKKASPAAVVSLLASRCRLSRRQAYRYLQLAKSAKEPLPVPESKSVFTVKLPLSLIEAVRKTARGRGLPISDLVTRALEDFLSKEGSHG